jgi:hypothetical protein
LVNDTVTSQNAGKYFVAAGAAEAVIGAKMQNAGFAAGVFRRILKLIY